MAEIVVAVEQTECYQCEASIEAEVGEVHPLCEVCQADFDAWFTRTLRSQV